MPPSVSAAPAVPFATYSTSSTTVMAQKAGHVVGSLLVPALLLWIFRKRPGCVLAIVAFVGLGLLSMLAIVVFGPGR
jgi:hypothetical protein